MKIKLASIATMTSLAAAISLQINAATSSGVQFSAVEDYVFSPKPSLQSADFFPGVLGQALADFDNDGDLDIFVTNSEGRANYLYINDGNGHFTDMAQISGVAMTQSNSTSVGLADFDNDGRLDLIVGRQSNTQGAPAHPVLLKNTSRKRDKFPTFKDISSEVGLDRLPENFRALGFAIADYDGNGLLDVFMGGFDLAKSADAGLALGTDDPNVILFNYKTSNKGFRLVNRTGTAGVAGVPVYGRTDETSGESWRPHTWVVYTTDLNQDSFPDLIVMNEAPGAVETYLNDGSGRFTFIDNPDLAAPGGYMGIASTDFNRDGFQDYFITNLGAELFKLGLPSEINIGSVTAEGSPYHLFLEGSRDGLPSNRAGMIDVAASQVLPPLALESATGLEAYGFGWGATFFDADNDGFDDLYWVGSHWPGMPLNGVGRFLKNMNGESFKDLTYEANLFNIPKGDDIAFSNAHNGYSVLAGDIDGDGDSDLVVVNGSDSAAEDASAGLRIFRNLNGNDQRQLKISLKSRDDNYFAIGAKVEIIVPSQASFKQMMKRETFLSGSRSVSRSTMQNFIVQNSAQSIVKEMITTTSSFSGVQPQLSFGLGDHKSFVVAKITWPDQQVSFRLISPEDSNVTISKRRGRR